MHGAHTVTDAGPRPRSGARGSHRGSKFLRELAAAGLPAGPESDAVVTAADLASLPKSAQRYFRFMDVVGRPRDWSFRARFTGRFRRGPGPWMAIEAWQYDTRLEIARIFHMRARLGGVFPTYVRDTYVKGRGRMLGKVLDLFPVVDATGAELDIGELVTYLNDAILMAPSMLLGPQTQWSAVDDASFDVALTDHGTRVTARVFVDATGAPTNFSTTDRFYSEGNGPWLRREWTTPIEGWQHANERDGRMLPTRAKAVWHLPTGELPYAEFAIARGDVTFNVPPGE